MLDLLRLWGLLALIVGLSGCGASVMLFGSAPLKTVPQRVALMPPEFPDELLPERAEIIQARMEGALKNAGYLLVDREIVERVCLTRSCPDRATLISRYEVEGFIDLKISSVSKNGFLAGYVDELRGELVLSDVSRPLLSVDHLETEAGGLLFQSGQLLEGLRAQAAHSGEAPFDLLAAKFARETVGKLPRPTQDAGKVATVPVRIVDASVKSINRDVFQVCAKGSPRALASVLVAGRRTNLRETAPGQFCGIYWLKSDSADVVEVELRSYFGHAVRRQPRSVS